MESTLLLGNIYYEATILSLQQSWVTFIYEATGHDGAKSDGAIFVDLLRQILLRHGWW